MARSEVAYFCHLSCDPPELATLDVPGIQSVLERFAAIFEEPTELQPSREMDHRIVLIAGAQAINVNPYCYISTFSKEWNRKADQGNATSGVDSLKYQSLLVPHSIGKEEGQVVALLRRLPSP